LVPHDLLHRRQVGALHEPAATPSSGGYADIGITGIMPTS
jgi:hypothetical protein